MSAQSIVEELRSLGSESIKRTLMNHGAREPFFGVKVEDLKKIQKRIKRDYQLALDLYATGISDAMYLAGLIADDAAMSRDDLQTWVDGAYWYMISEYTVPWVASGGRFGRELALEWIESATESVASSGWSTMSSLASIKSDEDLDIPELERLLDRVGRTIHAQPNRVRYVMNGFVICMGAFVPALTGRAIETARTIGPVAVDMGGTSCKVPFAIDYIEKIRVKGTIGKKRKSPKC